MKKLNIAVIGQGRSGRDIHGLYFKNEINTLYNVVAVAELDPERRERALKEYPGCVAVEDYREFYNMEGIDLVLNSTYSEMHYEVTKDLLLHKCNVLVEKPFARNYYECTDLIRIAKENGVVLAVFQQSFLTPYHQFTKKLIESAVKKEAGLHKEEYNGSTKHGPYSLYCV